LVISKKRFKAEQIVVLLRQIEVLMSQGKAAPVACRKPEYRSRAIIAGGRNTVVLSSMRPSE
jgi:hypothetical protein